MKNLKHVFTPLISNYKLVEEQQYMNGLSYINLVGFIIYDIVCIRLNIAYVVNVVRKFMSNTG